MRLQNSQLLVAAALITACASAPDERAEQQVQVFNIYRTGVEVPPSTMDGCEALGAVSATAPEPDAQGAGFFDPKGLLPTIRARAARKSADVVILSFDPSGLEYERRTLRGTSFRCGARELPPDLGAPLR